MSLTQKAIDDRRWHGLDVLRELVAKESRPEPTISLERLEDTLEVADRFNACAPDVVEGSEEYCREFRNNVAHLESRLKHAVAQLDSLAKRVWDRCDQIEVRVIRQEKPSHETDEEIAKLLTSCHMGAQGYGNLKVAARLAAAVYGKQWASAIDRTDPGFETARKLRSIVIGTAPVGYSNKDMIWKRFKQAALGATDSNY
jgi:hypothetical protein